MSKKLFTEQEIIILKQNKYVKKVTSKGITYTDEFKRIFIDENGNGKLPRIIFEECGFNIDIIGMQRVKSSARSYKTYRYSQIQYWKTYWERSFNRRKIQKTRS